MTDQDLVPQPSEDGPRAAAWRKRAFVVWTLVGACLLVWVLGYLLHVLAMPVITLVWTAIIFFCLNGFVDRLEAYRISRPLGTLIGYIVMFVVLGAVLLLMFMPVGGIVGQLANMLSSISGSLQSVVSFTDDIAAAYPALNELGIGGGIQSITDSISEYASSLVYDGANVVVGAASGLASSLMALGMALVVAFWLLMEWPGIEREAARLVPPARQDDAKFLHATVMRVAGGYIKGTLLQCVIIAVACGVLFSVLGVPSPIAFAAITGVMNIIPVVGPWLGGAAAGMAALSGGLFSAVLSLALTVVIQQVVYTFVSPKIMARTVDVHPAIIMVALLAGYAIGWEMSEFAGALLGMLFSVPVAAMAKSIFVYYFEKRTGRHLAADDGVFFKGAVDLDADPDPARDAMSPHPGMVAERAVADVRRKRRNAAVKDFRASRFAGAARAEGAKDAPKDEDGEEARR